MRTYPAIFKITLLAIFISVMPIVAQASHIVGGGFVYRYLGDTTMASAPFGKYEVSLYLYQDCKTGVPDAINADDPAFFTVYRSYTNIYRVDTNIYYNKDTTSDGAITLPAEVETACGKIVTEGGVCTFRKRFTKIYYLRKDTSTYTVVYQRCCRASNVTNIQTPGELGITFFCEIRPGVDNKSAVFAGHPIQVMCINKTTLWDQSAMDADGDSLTYALDEIYDGASGPDIKPRIASAPPYNTVPYNTGYAATQPMGTDGEVSIDERTGILTVSPHRMGVYTVAILCHEWRGGKKINTIRREMNWNVMDCAEINDFKPFVGGDRTVFVGDTIHFHAVNGVTYKWEPETYLNDANIADPVGTFTKPGEYTYQIYGESSEGCKGSELIRVRVIDRWEYIVANAFTPNGDGKNDRLIPIAVGVVNFKVMRIFNRWGNEVYTSKDPSAGWNGTYKGREQDGGVYVWMIDYTDAYGRQRMAKGTTILVR